MYNDPDCKPWTSRQWVPAGYSTRGTLTKASIEAGGNKGYEDERQEKAFGSGSDVA